jgi:hypothetical protein
MQHILEATVTLRITGDDGGKNFRHLRGREKYLGRLRVDKD